MSYNISNSLMQAYRSYKNGETCGLFFRAVYIDKICTTPTTDAQALGQWFEFSCTGQKPRSGVEPKPETTQKGELTAPYKKMSEQIENLKAIYKEFFNDCKFGVEVNYLQDQVNYKAIFDVQHPKMIRDIKTSGFIDNKWEKYGWVEIEKKPLVEQGYFYIWITYKTTGKILPFYYDVFSTANGIDCKVFKIVVSEEWLKEYEARLMGEVNLLKFDVATGLEELPEMKRCKTCPLFDGCNYKKLTPDEIIIQL